MRVNVSDVLMRLPGRAPRHLSWTAAASGPIMVGTHPAATGWVPEADGSVDPSTEGIHKDTDGPDRASDGVKYFAHLPGRFLVLVDFGVPALGRVTALTSSLAASFPGKDTDVFREEVPEKAAPS